MLRIFQNDLLSSDKFVVTLELVPGREAIGRSVDSVMGIAQDAYADGRISAVSITDNPGGNPALSPDVLGYEIFKLGMDVIVHFTCRDMNRVGMESRALQLAMMGMKNILALTGDYSGRGFGGQGAPVFDLDSVQLQILLGMLSKRFEESGDPDSFFAGCAVSPFKSTEAESFSQYAKLCRKAAAGAKFIITQLGYNLEKFEELIRIMAYMRLDLPVLASVYILTPKVARIMNGGKVPGAVVSDRLLHTVDNEWRNANDGQKAAIERAAKLAAVLKAIGYKGIHLGGVHHNFEIVAKILDRITYYEPHWQELIHQISFSAPGEYDMFPVQAQTPIFENRNQHIRIIEKLRYFFLKRSHDIFFKHDSFLSSLFNKMCSHLEGTCAEYFIQNVLEEPIKRWILNCQQCGDCGIQHVGFLCPESDCPKHMRNGACGGSRNGKCEVFPDRHCIWSRAYRRLAYDGKSLEMTKGCVPPRMWELNRTSSWFNFYLRRDHQFQSSAIVQRCKSTGCIMK